MNTQDGQIKYKTAEKRTHKSRTTFRTCTFEEKKIAKISLK